MRKEPPPIAQYMLGYSGRFNDLQAHESSPTLFRRLYLEPITQALAFAAADGIVVFYFPAETAPKGEDGVYLFDRRAQPLTRVTQSLSENLIKTTPEPVKPLRIDLANLPELPRDLPKEELFRPYLNQAILEEEWSTLIHLTGVAVAPRRFYEDGLVVRTNPTRVHLWSPILRMPSGRLVRQFAWLAADFIWRSENISIAGLGAQGAESDLNVLRLAREADLDPELTAIDPFGAVAGHLRRTCQSFEELLGRQDTDEAQVQAFLSEKCNHFLISPVHRQVHPKKRLAGGRYIPDFAVQCTDGDWELVEIEAPGRPIFQAVGQEPSAHLTHAMTQVVDWLRYVDDNRFTVEREDGFDGVYRPRGRVIAGRDQDLGDVGRTRFKFLTTQASRIEVATYDSLLSNARAYASVIAEMGGARARLESVHPAVLMSSYRLPDVS